MAMERKAERDGSDQAGGSAEGKRTAPAPVVPGGYFTAELAVLFLCLTALLVFLPLVLPPPPSLLVFLPLVLPPPPSLLLLVPVGLMAVLLALAFVPSDGRSTVAASCL